MSLQVRRPLAPRRLQPLDLVAARADVQLDAFPLGHTRLSGLPVSLRQLRRRPPGEDINFALRRLRRLVANTGLAREIRVREFALSPGVRRRRKHERAVLAQRKRRRRSAVFDFDGPVEGSSVLRRMPPSATDLNAVAARDGRAPATFVARPGTIPVLTVPWGFPSAESRDLPIAGTSF